MILGVGSEEGLKEKEEREEVMESERWTGRVAASGGVREGVGIVGGMVGHKLGMVNAVERLLGIGGVGGSESETRRW